MNGTEWAEVVWPVVLAVVVSVCVAAFAWAKVQNEPTYQTGISSSGPYCTSRDLNRPCPFYSYGEVKQ